MPRSDLLRVVAPPMRRHRAALGRSAAFTVARIGVDLAQPWPLALAVDVVVGGTPPTWLPSTAPVVLLAGSAAATVLLTAASGLLELGGTRGAERAAERLGADLREQVFRTAMDLSLRWHDGLSSGELVSRLTTDVGRLLDAVVALSVGLLPDVLLLIGMMTLLVVMAPSLALVGMAVVPLLAVLSVRQRRRVRAAESTARTAAGRLAGRTGDLVRNVRAVQAFGRTDRAAGLFVEHNRAALDGAIAAVDTTTRWRPISDVVLAVGAGAVLFVGGREVLAGQRSVGEMLVVLAYLRQLYSPIRSLTRLSAVLAKADASAVRLAAVLDCPDAIRDRPGARPVGRDVPSVSLHGVDFGYDAHHRVLDGVDLTVGAGEIVCLTGASGIGKSTVLHLLLRLYDVDGGSVRVDGVDVRDLQLATLRERIAFVPQDPWLLDATVAQNIAFGRRTASYADALAAGRIAAVDEFVDRLPWGWDTPLGEGGARLSGGQRRRVAIARAVVAGAAVLLLDEPTASLDAESAAAVIRAVRAAGRGRTTLVVTHDADLVAIADRVVVLGATDPATRGTTGPAAAPARAPAAEPAPDPVPVAAGVPAATGPVPAVTISGRR